MSRDRELVEEMKGIMRSHFSSPSLAEVGGEWYLYEKLGRNSFVSEDKGTWGASIPAPVWFRAKGWKVTPVIIHKVTAIR